MRPVHLANSTDGQFEDTTGVKERFRILMEIGRGGMATVYLAERLSLDVRKLVVLKVLSQELSAHPEMQAAFRREAHLSARMNHPSVVQVFEVVDHGGQTVIVMEFLDGLALSRVIKHAPLPLALNLEILTQVLDGLHHFHELTDENGDALNAVHRDVSPQNVMLLHDGIAKVLDFGVAKIQAGDADRTSTGLIKGKIHYMPPEQLLSGSDVDRRADLFPVGVMMWEALAGRRMWQGMQDNAVLRALARGEIPDLRVAKPDVAPELAAIVARALETDPDRRYSTALEMKHALEQAIPATVGTRRARDLAAFMQEHFAESRKQQREKVSAARRGSGDISLDHQGTVTGLSLSAQLGSASQGRARADSRTSAHSIAPPAQQTASTAPPPTRGALRWLLLGAGALMIGALAFGAHRLRAPAPNRPGQVAASKVDFRVMADPEEAEILLDGVLLGKGEYQGTRDRTGEQHELLTRATGYLPKQQQIRFDGDVIKLVRLERAPGSIAPEPRSASEESSSRPRRWRALQDMVDSASRSAPSQRPAASSAQRGPELPVASAGPAALAELGAAPPTSAAVVASPTPPAPTAALAQKPVAPEVKTTMPRLAPGCAPPRYPERSLERDEQGLVILRFLVDVDGSVKSAALVQSSGSGRLDEAARRAFEKCKFVPGTVNGQPKQAWVNQPFRWQIK